MPRVNIYIRNEDWEAWENIPDKPQWVHDGLTEMTSTKAGFNQVLPPKIIKTTADLEVSPQKVTGDRCPHGFNLKVSKCKYGCKK